MIIQFNMETSYKITQNVYALGNLMMPGYLIRGSKVCVLIDTGMTIMGPIYFEELSSCLKDNDLPLYVFITHSHYDHIGAVSYLKAHLPTLKIGAYYTIDTLLTNPHAVELITSLNLDGEKMLNINDPDIGFKPFKLDIQLKGGESFDIGDDELEVIYTPGHTKDSLCYYLRKQKIMFTGEAGGIRLPSGHILPEFLASYKLYLNSLNILAQYHVDYIATGHGPVISGAEAGHFFKDSIKATYTFIERIRSYYKEMKSIDKVVERIKYEDYEASGSGQPERAYTINLQAKVKAVVEDK
jgi:glyoxylase-like metal-dependent hydrolase (beta-lactamase superfamily II)